MFCLNCPFSFFFFFFFAQLKAISNLMITLSCQMAEQDIVCSTFISSPEIILHFRYVPKIDLTFFISFQFHSTATERKER